MGFTKNLKLYTQVIRSNRLRWLGHIWRSPENNQTRAYTFKNPMGSRTRGRPPLWRQPRPVTGCYAYKEEEAICILVQLITMASSSKEQKVQDSKRNRELQTWGIEKYGIISKGKKAVCVLCSGTVVCRASSVKWHFEANHKSSCQKSEPQ
ncbi:general transcription factor II-I repeat domain-containing protein 2A [Trichonephila clavipes]|nr:general transcription factor II-I repeat domain-containing protein 2A [Trichonephila clavipes]